MTDTIFCDLSEHQRAVDFSAYKAGGYDVIAHRIAYGSTYTDKRFFERLPQIRATKFVAVIYYFFFRNQPLQDQFNTFTRLLPFLLPGEAVALDWENDLDGSLPSIKSRNALLQLLDDFYHQPTILYGPGHALKVPQTTNPVWVASYGTAEPVSPHLIWQFSNGQISSNGLVPPDFPGIGRADSSIYHGSATRLAATISPAFAIKQSTTSAIESDDMSDAFTITYPTGHKVVGGKDGGIANLGGPFYGSVPGLKAESRQNITKDSLLGLTAIDPNNETAGYRYWNKGSNGTETYDFTPETWIKIQNHSL